MRNLFPFILQRPGRFDEVERRKTGSKVMERNPRKRSKAPVASKKTSSTVTQLPSLNGCATEGVFSAMFLQKLLRFGRILIPEKSEISSLRMVRFSNDNGLSAAFTDLTNIAQLRASSFEGNARGTILVPFELLRQIGKVKPDFIRFHIENNQGIIGYESGGVSRKEDFPVIPAEEYPSIDVPQDGYQRIDLNLPGYIQEASAFTADASNNTPTTGILLDGTLKSLAATDGKRLYCRHQIPFSFNDRVIIPPNKALQYMENASVGLKKEENMVWIKSASATLGLMRVEGTFPDYNRVLDIDLSSYTTHWKIAERDRKTLVKLLPTLMYENKELPVLHLKLDRDRLSIHTGKGGGGEFRTSVEGQAQLRVNAAFLRNILMVEDILECRISDKSNQPIMFTGKAGIKMLLMPLLDN